MTAASHGRFQRASSICSMFEACQSLSNPSNHDIMQGKHVKLLDSKMGNYKGISKTGWAECFSLGQILSQETHRHQGSCSIR